jgi:GTP-binding protein LepA
MEIVEERLEREFGLELIVTAPSVKYRVMKTNGDIIDVDSPARMPDPGQIEAIEEPIITATILTAPEFVGAILQLCQDKRGIQKNMGYITPTRVMITYELPMAEVLLDFYDRLKSASKGYASLDYQLTDYRPGDLVKLDILLNGEAVDALAVIVHRDKAVAKGRALCEKMKEMIPQQMFEVVIQAAIGSKILARSTVRAMRKNVIAKCYGGDITRKKKLLEKQKEGKRRMKKVGRVDLPQEAFLAVLKVDS